MEEKILMGGITNQVAGLVVKNGYGILTTKRFIYKQAQHGEDHGHGRPGERDEGVV